jgi:hypothetical protein
MIITLKAQGNIQGIEKLKKILNIRFSGLARFSRFILRSLLPFIRYYEKTYDKNYFRINILLGKKIKFLKSNIHKLSGEHEVVPKYTKAFAYLVPSSKSVFQTTRNEDPALELMRQRSHRYNKLSVKNSP